MTERADTGGHADRVASWATGVGIGLIVLMLVWLVGNRLTALVLDPPVGPSVALAAAIVAGSLTAAIAGSRLSGRVAGDALPPGEGRGGTPPSVPPGGGFGSDPSLETRRG